MVKSPTLDPEDWESFRNLAHQMVDVMIDQMQRLDDQPVWTPPPKELIAKWSTEPAPQQGIGEQAAFDLFCKEVLPFGNGSWHPRFLGWVQGTGVPLGMMADMLASGLNSHLAGFHTAPKWIELLVIRWVAELLGFDPSVSGILTSGGSMANILALHVARHRSLKWNECDQHPSIIQGRLRLYASDQVHGWLWKGMELLGLGRESVVVLPSIEGKLDVDALQRAIEQDVQDKLLPWCLVASVGTVHTGAIDDLDACASLCARNQIWFHIDGAFGALANLVPEYQGLLKSMSLADSLAVDLHKWMYLPFEIGTLLVRDPESHRAAFAMQQVYMTQTDRGLLAGGVPLADRGVELTRSFKALKAWMCIQAYGIQRFADSIEQNIRLARQFASTLSANAEFELLAPTPLNIVCFRHLSSRFPNSKAGIEWTLNAWNEELLLRLQESGVAVLSSTRIGDRFALRAAFSNHRTQEKDLPFIVRTMQQIAAEMSKIV